MRLGIVLIVTALTSSLYAQDAWPVRVAPSREPSPFQYKPDLWKKVPQSFLTDAPACVLYASSVHLVEEDGTIEAITHDVTRVTSRHSIDDLGEYTNISFRPRFEKLTLNLARIHKKKGGIVSVQPRHVHLRQSTTDFQTYSPSKILVISFPGLEVGDTIEVKWTTRGKNPEHGNQFFYRYKFGAVDYPIVKDELVVQLPKKMPFHYELVNGHLKTTVSEEKKARTYRWTALNLSRQPKDEDRPSSEESRLQVCCSTFKDWNAVAKWKRSLRKLCWVCTPEMRQLALKLTKHLKSPEEKARALTYWVKRNIRYLSKGVGHDYTPHHPKSVLLNRQGDCKDTSQLLAVMLKEVGIEVAHVTLGVLGDGHVLEKVPSLWGTHAILMATINGKRHWIDTTASLAGWDMLPRNARDRQCYVIDDKSIRLIRTPPLTPEEHRFEQTTTVSISADGTTRSHRVSQFYGLAGYHQRNRWLDVPKGERIRKERKRLRTDHSRTNVLDLKLDSASLWDFDAPLKSEMTFEIPRRFEGAKPEASFADARIWNYLVGYRASYDRKVALELYAPTITRHRYVITSCPGTEPDGLPFSKTIRSRWGTFSRKLRWGKTYRTAIIEFELRIERTRVRPEEMDEYRKFHRAVKKYHQVWLTLENVNHARNIAKLEAMLKKNPKDEATALQLGRLYLHHGERVKARAMLTQSRRHNPKSVKLWEMSVKAEDNLKQKIALQRKLTKLFSKDPTHSITLATLLIDDNLHDLARASLLPLTKHSEDAVRCLAFHQLARSFAAEKKYEDALLLLKQAEKLKSSLNPLVLFMLRGRIHEEQKEFSLAFQAYEKAHAKDPKSRPILSALIRVAKAGKDQSGAVRYLRHYIVRVGDDFDGLINAANLAWGLERIEDAEELALRARKQRFHSDIQRILGLIALRRENYEKALHHLSRAESTSDVLAGQMRAHLSMGDLTAASRSLDQMERLRIKPEGALLIPVTEVRLCLARKKELLRAVRPSPKARSGWVEVIDYLVCAENAYRQKNLERANRLTEQAISEKRPLGAAHGLLAMLRLKQGKLRDALSHANRAIQLDPVEVHGWLARGIVRFEREKPSAISDLEKAAVLTRRSDLAVLKLLIKALIQGGLREKATKTIKDAIRLAPEDETLRALLREVS